MTNDVSVRGLNKRAGLQALESDPLRNFRYVVKFLPYWPDGTDPKLGSMKFGFTSVSGLSVATEAIPYREGGHNTTLHQIPGQSTFSPVTLSRGVHLGNRYAWDWIRRLFSVVGGAEGSTYEVNFRCSVDIHVLLHPVERSKVDTANHTWRDEESDSQNDLVGLSFRLYNAWIQSLAYSDLNAGDNAVLVEQIVLAHEGFDMRWPTLKDEQVSSLDATPANASGESYWRYDNTTGKVKK